MKSAPCAASALTLIITASLTAFCQLPAHGQLDGLFKPYQIENTVYKLCQEAGVCANNKQYQKSIELLMKAASYDPTSYSKYIHLDLARCYQEMDQYSNAIKEAETALKFAPNSERAYYSIAISNYNTKKFDKAMASLDAIIKTTKDAEWLSRAKESRREFDTYKNYYEGLQAIRGSHWQRAKQLLTKAAAYDPSRYTASVHAGLSQALREMGEPEGSISEARIALKANPRDPMALQCMAVAYGDLGQIDDAINWWKKYRLTILDDPKRKAEVESTIDELSDDRFKAGGASVNLPDYFESMRQDDDYCRWSQKSLPLRVHITKPASVPGFKPYFPFYITRALDRWCELSGKKLSYVLVPSKDKADITVEWTDRPLISKQKGKDRLAAGITHLHPADDKFYATALVIIATRSRRDNEFYEDGEVASTCMHEVGHALGLGHSKNVRDVMYYSSSKMQSGLPTKRDGATMARVYSDYPPIGFAPQTPQDAPEVKYLPPPEFLPPAPEPEEPLPPLFTPPPPFQDETLPPPLFTPPPPSQGNTKDKPAPAKSRPKNTNADPPPPLFTPPPG